ncbi:hypothetical protein QTO34_006616 [Cnephaeus nilssonii]|uniref:SOCS box domain-containing protein n=1 Tax=Cnephaeus nilssonii TaxID=3371016 RepID=A0AA40HKV5_CNENI|nr:hypothetical protein QTO34_006616 [Eptesicus nilssonii]
MVVRILALLIPLTNRVCDTGPDKVSPVYSAVFGGHEDCLEMLLQHGYSPDAQMCLVFGFSSPLCMAFQKDCEFFGIVNILLKYGVQLNELHLAYCLKYEKFSVFRYFLKKGCPLAPWNHMSEFINHAIKAQTKYKEWLPSLLLAGFDPLNLLCSSWIDSVSDDTLIFTLEFTNWRRLPPAVEKKLSARVSNSSWALQQHIAAVPSLTHLCRMEIRSILKPEHLRSDNFICQLPLPRSLQNYLLYSEVLRMNEVPELAAFRKPPALRRLSKGLARSRQPARSPALAFDRGGLAGCPPVPQAFRKPPAAMVQTLSSRRHWPRELSVLLAQSATPATLSPAPCASCWPNRGRSGVMGWEVTWRSGEGDTPITPLLLPLLAAQASAGPGYLSLGRPGEQPPSKACLHLGRPWAAGGLRGLGDSGGKHAEWPDLPGGGPGRAAPAALAGPECQCQEEKAVKVNKDFICLEVLTPAPARMPPASVDSLGRQPGAAPRTSLRASRRWHFTEAQGFQLGSGIAKGGKNSVPNLISDLEPGPRNSFWPHRRDDGGKDEERHSKAAALSLLWPSASEESRSGPLGSLGRQKGGSGPERKGGSSQSKGAPAKPSGVSSQIHTVLLQHSQARHCDSDAKPGEQPSAGMLKVANQVSGMDLNPPGQTFGSPSASAMGLGAAGCRDCGFVCLIRPPAAPALRWWALGLLGARPAGSLHTLAGNHDVTSTRMRAQKLRVEGERSGLEEPLRQPWRPTLDLLSPSCRREVMKPAVSLQRPSWERVPVVKRWHTKASECGERDRHDSRPPQNPPTFPVVLSFTNVKLQFGATGMERPVELDLRERVDLADTAHKEQLNSNHENSQELALISRSKMLPGVVRNMAGVGDMVLAAGSSGGAASPDGLLQEQDCGWMVEQVSG